MLLSTTAWVSVLSVDDSMHEVRRQRMHGHQFAAFSALGFVLRIPGDNWQRVLFFFTTHAGAYPEWGVAGSHAPTILIEPHFSPFSVVGPVLRAQSNEWWVARYGERDGGWQLPSQKSWLRPWTQCGSFRVCPWFCASISAKIVRFTSSTDHGIPVSGASMLVVLCTAHFLVESDSVNSLECRGNYSATSNNMKLVHWSCVWAVTFGTARRGLGGAGARPGPSSLYQM